MSMRINNKFSLEDVVYLVTDSEQTPHIITGIIVHPGGLTYMASTGGEVTEHYDFELSYEKTVR